MGKAYIHIDSPDCKEKLIRAIAAQIQAVDKTYNEICVACVGTDRATGDCLGPLVGHKLSGANGIKVIGTLEQPLHAKNLKDFVESLSQNQLVIAVDACLGEVNSIGNLVVERGSILPGYGVGKELPPIGDISIKGIVNFAGLEDSMSIMIMQNTRLSIAMKMADIIAGALQVALCEEDSHGREVKDTYWQEGTHHIREQAVQRYIQPYRNSRRSRKFLDALRRCLFGLS